MRVWSVFGVFLVAGTLLPIALNAQNFPQVKHMSVREDGSAIEVEIHTTGAISSPNTQAITSPDRIVVDFPGALPATELRALKVNRGPLKNVRSGLFFNDPPITRIVLDLTSAQPYQIFPVADGVVIKLGAVAPGSTVARTDASDAPAEPRIGGARLTTVARTTGVPGYASVAARAPRPAPRVETPPPAPEPPKPTVDVTYQNGMLRIYAEKATLAEVLFAVQQQTHAEIAIPAGAEQEQVITDLGPAPPRDVLASLLNGSPYNFIFVGTEQDGGLEKVILSRRDPSF